MSGLRDEIRAILREEIAAITGGHGLPKAYAVSHVDL